MIPGTELSIVAIARVAIVLFVEENPSTPAQAERCLVPTLDHSSFRAELQQHTWQFNFAVAPQSTLIAKQLLRNGNIYIYI